MVCDLVASRGCWVGSDGMDGEETTDGWKEREGGKTGI